MQKNIGMSDRILRFILSLVFFLLAFWQNSIILGLFGAFTLYEALASWCVLYWILGKSSCPIQKK